MKGNEDLIRALQPVTEAAGVAVEGADRIAPKVNLDEPVRDLAMKLGGLLRRCGIFRPAVGRELFTVDREGRKERMDAVRFCSWVEAWVTVVKSFRMKNGEYGDMRVSMGKDLAAKIVGADVFIEQVPRLEWTSEVRLPVRRESGEVALAESGFDEEGRVFCNDGVRFDENMSLEDAKGWWTELCSGFGYADGGDLWCNRNFLVHLSAALGVFCRLLLPPMTIRPLIMYVANQQGAGKSLQMAMALSGCFGEVASAKLPISQKGGVNAEKLEALLDTVAQTFQSYLALDDVPGYVISNALNAFITSPRHQGRVYGSNKELYDVPAVTQVFVTGNNVTLERDLMHRMLVCELWMTRDADSVRHQVEMTPRWLSRPETRARTLASLWAMVRTWAVGGCAAGPWVKPRAPEWSRLVGGVLSAIGVTVDPFETPDLPMAGDQRGEEIRAVLVALAEGLEDCPFDDERGRGVDLDQFIEKARGMSMLVDLVGTAEDKGLQKKDRQRLGQVLKGWRGRDDLVTGDGRRFQFGQRKQERGAFYPIKWLA